MQEEIDRENAFGAYRRSEEAVLAALGSNEERGLTQAEADARLAKYGPNELAAETPVPEWRKVLAQFSSPLVILLLVATGVSTAIWFYEGESALPYEALAILGVVILNAMLGYFQEARAEAAVKALRAMTAAEASVLRDGERHRVPAANLVPGDILLLEEGDRVPADGRVVRSTALQTAEAALTGESLPVAKETEPIEGEVGLGDRRNMVFSGSSVTYGRGTAVVVATGMQTEMGRIAGMLRAEVDEATPLQRELKKVGIALGAGVLLIAILMIGILLLVGDFPDLTAYLHVFVLGVALAVAAVPEGLPAVVTAVLALGVQRMARRKAIVRHLAAVETLGSADVIASDKTGTLTQNEMTVRCVVVAGGRIDFSGVGYAPEGEVLAENGSRLDGALSKELERALTVADCANNSVVQQEGDRWVVQGDPTEGALRVAARKAGLEAENLRCRWRRIDEAPFSSERKLMSALHEDAEAEDRLLVFSKGAPDILLDRCEREYAAGEERPLTPERREEIRRTNDDLAAQALRTLAVAYREVAIEDVADRRIEERHESRLVFAGLLGMIDPPRAEAKEAVAKARRAGIRPILITGDHPKTAGVIARELGIVEHVQTMTGSELQAVSDEELLAIVREVSVYARVNPEHKLRIVKALQREGHTVAMTGDGVNDAPALKAADIGVAMGIAGTDVSKEAADIVLVDDNFATIVAAIEEGRGIYANIRKFLRYLLSSNVGEVMTMFFGVLGAKAIGLPSEEGAALPLLATQILWINLVTDGPPAMALGVDPSHAGAMRRPPRPREEGVLTLRMWAGVFFVATIMAAGTLFVLDASLPGGFVSGTGDMPYARTMAFTTLTLFQLFNVFNARSDDRSAFRGLFRNKWLWLAVGFSLALQVGAIYLPFLQQAFSTVPLGLSDWAICFGVASSVVWLRELSKLVQSAVSDRRT